MIFQLVITRSIGRPIVSLPNADSTESPRGHPRRARARFSIYLHGGSVKFIVGSRRVSRDPPVQTGRGDALLGKSFRRMPLYPRGGPSAEFNKDDCFQ